MSKIVVLFVLCALEACSGEIVHMLCQLGNANISTLTEILTDMLTSEFRSITTQIWVESLPVVDDIGRVNTGTRFSRQEQPLHHTVVGESSSAT